MGKVSVEPRSRGLQLGQPDLTGSCREHRSWGNWGTVRPGWSWGASQELIRSPKMGFTSTVRSVRDQATLRSREPWYSLDFALTGEGFVAGVGHFRAATGARAYAEALLWGSGGRPPARQPRRNLPGLRRDTSLRGPDLRARVSPSAPWAPQRAQSAVRRRRGGPGADPAPAARGPRGAELAAAARRPPAAVWRTWRRVGARAAEPGRRRRSGRSPRAGGRAVWGEVGWGGVGCVWGCSGGNVLPRRGGSAALPRGGLGASPRRGGGGALGRAVLRRRRAGGGSARRRAPAGGASAGCYKGILRESCCGCECNACCFSFLNTLLLLGQLRTPCWWEDF